MILVEQTGTDPMRSASTASPDTSAERWAAVQRRAPREHTHFVYAVRTTGIFCRPGCASRLPRRENVEFFDTAVDARSAGYRPCKRCQPESSSPHGATRDALVEACRLLSSEELKQTRDVARAVGLSPSYFQRAFKLRLGVTPQQYRRRVLAERGREALSRADSVTASVYEAGYASSSRFYEGVGRELGMKPSVARRGGPGERIRYVTERCSLGVVLIAWTDRGVCSVALGDSTSALVDELRNRFDEAEVEEASPPGWVRALVDALGTGTAPDFPLDIRGTAFQERVWQALRGIPAGQTRTYAELAQAVGNPAAVRAVAGACAANPLAVVIPCHRVVRKDGDLAGYRWGVERKQELLRREKAGQDPAG